MRICMIYCSLLALCDVMLCCGLFVRVVCIYLLIMCHFGMVRLGSARHRLQLTVTVALERDEYALRALGSH